MFKKIREYYNLGLWDERQVRNAVVKGKITADEFRLITGKIYE
ncbi:MAG: XkdX family protein [Synergistaceae bacterium]|nr:XkdX family protein [Synergistaceae bacterium]